MKRSAQLDGIEEMQRRHCEVASELVELVRESCRRLRAEMDRDEKKRLPVSSFASVLNAASTLERVSRGEPETIVRELEQESETLVILEWPGEPGEPELQWPEVDGKTMRRETSGRDGLDVLKDHEHEGETQ